jgi:hypothetical protein
MKWENDPKAAEGVPHPSTMVASGHFQDYTHPKLSPSLVLATTSWSTVKYIPDYSHLPFI